MRLGHHKTRPVKRFAQCDALFIAQFDQGRANMDPVPATGFEGDGGFHGRDHGKLGKSSPLRIEPFLLLVGIGVLPGLIQPHDGAGVDVAGGGDAAGTAATHRGQQEILAAGENIEALRLEALQHGRGVGPVA